MARRPVACAICSRQLNPSETMQRLRGRLPHGRQQHSFAHRLRNRVFLLLESKRAGHSAAARIRRLEIHAHLPQQRLFVTHLHERFLMAVAVQQHLARKRRRLVAGRVLLEKFAEKKRLAGAGVGARRSSGNRLRSSSRKTEAQLGSSTTTGSPLDRRTHVHNAQADIPGLGEHSEIVERPPAAQAAGRGTRYAKARLP